MSGFLSCLQHSRPCCIGYTNSRLRLEFVYPIQHGRSCCKHYIQSNLKLSPERIFSEMDGFPNMAIYMGTRGELKRDLTLVCIKYVQCEVYLC
jgi:hypothetical protein